MDFNEKGTEEIKIVIPAEAGMTAYKQ